MRVTSTATSSSFADVSGCVRARPAEARTRERTLRFERRLLGFSIGRGPRMPRLSVAFTLLALAVSCGGSSESGLFKEGEGGSSGSAGKGAASGSGGQGATGGAATGGSSGTSSSGGSGGSAGGSGGSAGGSGGSSAGSAGQNTGGSGALPDGGTQDSSAGSTGTDSGIRDGGVAFRDVVGADTNNPTACPPLEPVAGTTCNVFTNSADCRYGARVCVCMITVWLCVP